MAKSDNVATSLDDLSAGREFDVSGQPVSISEGIPFGHKFALQAIDDGEKLYKYGEVIGRATRPIEPGDWVHTHNCESTRGRGDLSSADASGGEQA